MPNCNSIQICSCLAFPHLSHSLDCLLQKSTLTLQVVTTNTIHHCNARKLYSSFRNRIISDTWINDLFLSIWSCSFIPFAVCQSCIWHDSFRYLISLSIGCDCSLSSSAVVANVLNLQIRKRVAVVMASFMVNNVRNGLAKVTDKLEVWFCFE